MAPAFPKRLFVGLPTTVALATLLLGLAGSSSSESLPLPGTGFRLGLEAFVPELAGPLFDAPQAEPDPVAARSATVSPDRSELRRALADRYLAELPFGRQIREAARAHHVDALLVASVVEAESSFRPDAVSSKGALGLMQLMPFHMKGVEQPLDPATNLGVGARYLSRLSRRYHGDVELALAAYHAGPGAVRRFGGVPPFRSTRSYVGRVLSLYREHWQSVDRQLSEFGRPGTGPAAGDDQRGS